MNNDAIGGADPAAREGRVACGTSRRDGTELARVGGDGRNLISVVIAASVLYTLSPLASAKPPSNVDSTWTKALS